MDDLKKKIMNFHGLPTGNRLHLVKDHVGKREITLIHFTGIIFCVCSVLCISVFPFSFVPY